MAEETQAHLATARAAFISNKWAAAREAYTEADEANVVLGAKDLEQFGYACILAGASDFSPLDRAFLAYEQAGDVQDAARIGADLIRCNYARGRRPAAQGWARRAQRILQDAPPGPGHAHMSVFASFMAQMEGKVEEALVIIERAYAIARDHDDHDAEALALNRRGNLLVRCGRIEEGKADLDEAMVLVHADAVRPMPGATIYCSTINACADMADYERAMQWTDAAQPWIEERSVMGYPGVCRMHRAELYRLQGDWDGASREAQAALEVLERGRMGIAVGYAHGEMGMQKLERGDLDGAAQCFRFAGEFGIEPMPALAILEMRKGYMPRARSMLEAALDTRSSDPLGRGSLLPSYVEVCITLGDLDAAGAGVRELDELAASFGTVGFRARASTAAARLHLREGKPSAAIAAARTATREWNTVGAAYEMARSRELLASAYTLAGDPARATIEQDAARRALAAMDTRAAQNPSTDDTIDARAASPAKPPPLSHDPRIHEGVLIDDKIEVGPLLGAGAMGLVYAGRHRITGRDVAIKVLQRGLCGDTAQCKRFLQEALACGRIRHPHVVDIYDAGEHAGQLFIIMERLQGESLGDRLCREPKLSDAETVDLCLQIAHGVAAAHGAAVVHRDLKPDNVFLCSTQTDRPHVKLVDFGISKLADADHTRAGALLGTPFYMAPEQVRDSTRVDERTDVHAIGAIAFESLTGRPPYVGDSAAAVLYAIAEGPAPRLDALRADLEPALVSVVERALARDPRDRYESANAMASALAELTAK